MVLTLRSFASARGTSFGSSAARQRSIGLKAFWLSVGTASADLTDSSVVFRAMLGDNSPFGLEPSGSLGGTFSCHDLNIQVLTLRVRIGYCLCSISLVLMLLTSSAYAGRIMLPRGFVLSQGSKSC